MKSTQNHLIIGDIKEDMILLKSGGATIILQSSAVNFDLLSEVEQTSIIQSFAQMLNSLSFPIQIVVRSKRLDITSYLRLLDRAISFQRNQLLSQLMVKYRQFVQSLIGQNEVLDKEFFIVISVSGLELGILPKKKEEVLKQAQTLLLPRKEQVVKQLTRVGLKATQLQTKELVELFYDIYNPPQGNQQIANVAPQPSIQTHLRGEIKISPSVHLGGVTQQIIKPTTVPHPPLLPIIQPRPSRTHPFIVEELI